MVRIETRGPEIGICNICGLTSRLTDDHIPPKGAPLVGQAYLERLSDTLGATKIRSEGRIFQRGVKYRSICAACNTKLLGIFYDPTLIDFCKRVHAELPKRVHAPFTLHVQQNRLFRSVVGHVLAHGLGRHRMGPFSSDKTDYFLDQALSFPRNLRLYCWLYPYKPQVVARGFSSIFDFRFEQESGVYSILKFFPLGWLCSDFDLPAIVASQVIRVDQLATDNIDDFCDITFSPSNIPPPRWPEAPGKNGATFLHSDFGTIASPVHT